MTKNLTWKLVLIVGTLLIFLFGIFGVPKDWSGKGLLTAITDRIHLGLDLRGGTHLILQVKVNDAVNVDSDAAIERLKEALRTAKINYADISKPDVANNPDRIVIKGVPPESAGDLRDIVTVGRGSLRRGDLWIRPRDARTLFVPPAVVGLVASRGERELGRIVDIGCALRAITLRNGVAKSDYCRLSGGRPHINAGQEIPRLFCFRPRQFCLGRQVAWSGRIGIVQCLFMNA